MSRIRCYHEYCCYEASSDFRPITGYDGITRTWGACSFHNPAPSGRVWTASLVVGYGPGYIGDSASPELDGMTFRLVSRGELDHDMADMAASFYACVVEVGAETWDVLIPSDATFEMVPPQI